MASVEEDPFLPGVVYGTSTYFALTNSEYFNVSVDSTELLELRLESIPNTISLYIGSSTVEEWGAASSTTITLSNLASSTTFHLYADSYTNGTTIITDSNGGYIFSQDISQPHFIWLQPIPGTIFINEDTTLTSDVFQSIEITAPNVVLDCAGHSVNGEDSGIGIFVPNKNGVTVKNCAVNNFTRGIYYFFSHNGAIHDNSGNSPFSISLDNSTTNTIAGNNFSHPLFGIAIRSSSNDNAVSANVISDALMGILIGRSSNNHIFNNTATNNLNGIRLGEALNNVLSDNIIDANSAGIDLSSSPTVFNNNIISNNQNFGVIMSGSPSVFSGNIITNNNRGIDLSKSNSSIINNTISNNGQYGIHLFQFPNGGGSGIIGNTISHNGAGGININSSRDNVIYNNYFNNAVNVFGIGALQPTNLWNISKTPGTNIIGGQYLGGNFWANPNSTGFSQECVNDAGRDGICDNSFVIQFLSGNVDQLPLIFPLPPNEFPIASAGGPYIGQEGSPIVFDGSGSSDPDGDTLQYRWDFNNDGVWDTDFSASPTAQFTFDDDHIGAVKLEVTDGEFFSLDTASVTVENVAPLVIAGNNQAINEGEIIHFFGSFTDPGILDTHTLEWNFGDGAIINGTFTPVHTYADNGTFIVTLTIIDNNGGIGSDLLTVIVENVAPTVNAGSNQVIEVFDEARFNGSFTDPGILDTHTFEWNFGDGTSTTGSLNVSHFFNSPGVYSVTLTVTDNDGGIGTNVLTLTVEQNYAVWGNYATGTNVVDFSGDGTVINGRIHSNNDIYIGGSGKIFNSTTTFVTTFTDAGNNNIHPIIVQASARQLPLLFDVQDYQPGGAKALAAEANGKYTFVDGDLTVPGNSVLDGLYFVTGKVKLNGSGITGIATIVALSDFEINTNINGSNFNLSNYIDDLLFLTTANRIKMTGSNHYLEGIIYVSSPAGSIELGGSGHNIYGGLFADFVKINGSEIIMNAKTTH